MMASAQIVGMLALSAGLPGDLGSRRAGRLTLSTAPDATLQALFDPPHRHQLWSGAPVPPPPPVPPPATTEFDWLGADCASSLRLPSRGPNATLWLFGDTLLGSMGANGLRKQQGCFMPHQVRRSHAPRSLPTQSHADAVVELSSDP